MVAEKQKYFKNHQYQKKKKNRQKKQLRKWLKSNFCSFSIFYLSLFPRCKTAFSSLFTARFACFNFISYILLVNVLNSEVVIYLLWLDISFSTSPIFVFEKFVVTIPIASGILSSALPILH